MARIIIACNKKPLAAFIETELVGGSVDCRFAVDVAQLMMLTAEFKPDVLLFDSEFPSSDESLALLGKLRGCSAQIPIVGILEPFGEGQDEIRQVLSPANILQLPFSGDDLRERLEQVGSLEIKKRVVSQEKKEEKEMDKPQTVSVETVELTEMVEEGLPLDELPEIFEDKTSGVLLEVDSGEVDTAGRESESESKEALELDGFGDTLDDLESVFEESVDVGFDSVVESSTEIDPELESRIESKAGENSSELVVAGDIDALLADDDFTEIEIPESPENRDPVLAELKSAGLTPEDEVVVEPKSDAASVATSESLEPVENQEAAADSDETLTTESVETEIELPEDYLLDEEVPVASVESEPTEAEVCAEPFSLDFSQQIESMTQEWSKQLLQTTYASMDKMIKAIGDLAPTIVAQVAREVIPPLAEKVIKAEIARLEEKLESEEEQEEISNS